MRSLNVFAAALLVTCLAIAGEASAQKVLRVSTWLPSSHPIVADMIKPWAAEIERATTGRVRIQVMDAPLGPPPAQFDIVQTGQADIGYGVHGYTPGRFTLTKLAELPFLDNRAEALSVAYWRTHDRFLAKADEHKGVKLLSVFTHGPGHIFTTKWPIAGAADLRGLKIRVGGGVVNDVAKALGAVPLLEPSSKAYEILANGVADGIFFPHESVPFFKLDGVVKHGTIVPNGLYNTSFFLVMNQASFNGLSAEDQAALMSRSGEAFAKRAGATWDKADAAGLARMKSGGMDFQDLSPHALDAIRKTLAPIEMAIIAEVSAKGVDGKAGLELIRTEAAAYK
jgi:TRAP-type C4-dicarboxylate transport system substrate-binding protein